MLRPPRRKKRFQGGGLEATGSTNLSNTQEEADGRAMRRKYAFFAALCLLFLAGIIALIAKGGSKNAKPAELSKKSDTKTASVTMENFLLVNHAFVTPVQAEVNTYTHKKSGMQILTITPTDTSQDATFGLNFRTVPDNNHGTAHVVEHALSSGSENYPVKDPFNQLERGSLQTHMETLTGKDRTSYVMASRNKVDFRNSIKVILDGIFHPLMNSEEHKWIFRQEGWRLEVYNNKDLYISGNAFNEAKAAQMQPSESMFNYIYKSLFKSHPYAWNARGESQNIVSLTWEEMVQFHQRYYHPSNGQAFCYGPEDYVNECLGLLDGVLSDFEADEYIRQETVVPWENKQNLQSGLDAIPYASYEETNDFRLAQAWVLNDQHMDDRTEVAWFLIQELLIGSPVAALSKTISDLALGDDIIGGLEHTLQQWTLTLGVSGVPDSAKVTIARNAIVDKLQLISTSGFHEDAMTAAMNRVDFKLRQMMGSGIPLGVATFHSILSKWNYDQDPKTPLYYPKAFADLKQEMKDGGQDFILELITKRLLENKHTLSVELFPSLTVAQNHANDEQVWLDNLDDYLTKEEGLAILRESSLLHERQEGNDSEEDLAKIPRLTIADLNKTVTEIPMTEVHDIFDSGVTMIEHELPFTSGLAFVDFAIDISNMDFDDVVLLPLFCRMIVESGNDRKSDVHFRREVDSETGGISAQPLIEEILQTNSEGGYIVPDGKHLISKIVVRASCVSESGCFGMFSLIKQILFDSDMTNKKKAVELLQHLIDDMEDDIQDRGSMFTTTRITSRYSLTGFVSEQWKGITQLFNLRRALYQAKTNWDELSDRLVLMQDAMKRGNRNGMLLSVTGDKQSIKDISAGIQIFVRDTLPPAAQVTRFPDFSETEHPWVTKGLLRMKDEINAEFDGEAFIIPTRVNHVGKGGVLYDLGERVKGSDRVVSQYLGGYYLYEKLRFNLGAQEAWSFLDIDSGIMIYQSDRDPNIMETLAVYEDGASWLWDQVNRVDDGLPVEAKGAIVGAVADLDGTQFQPAAVGYVSMMQYLKKDSLQSRQLWRDEVIGATKEDFMRMAERLGSWGEPKIVVVTSQQNFDKALKTGLNMTACDYDGYSCALDA
jgi:Zn-dependent M16 (insulinase) family peptidase